MENHNLLGKINYKKNIYYQNISIKNTYDVLSKHKKNKIYI